MTSITSPDASASSSCGNFRNKLRGIIVIMGTLAFAHTFLWAQFPNVFPNAGNAGIGSALIPPVKPLHILTTTNYLNGDPSIRLSYGDGIESPNVERFWGHLVLTTPNNRFMPDYPYCRGWNAGGPYGASVGDLVLVNGRGRPLEVESRDVIISTLDPSGYLRFSTTPTEGANDIERLTITPNGKVGINTITPLGYLDINMSDGWAENLPKISFTHDGNAPQMRLYNITGWLSSPYTIDRHEAFSWYIEHGQEQFQGALRFRAGTGGIGPNPPFRSLIGTETTTTRVTFLSNGNVGINEVQPITKLQVRDGAVLFNGPTGATPTNWDGSELGAGTRLMWIPAKGAFREGILFAEADNAPWSPVIGADETQFWNDMNVGNQSIAMGRNCEARGTGDIAIGLTNIADAQFGATIAPSGHGAVAIGHDNLCTGTDALAFGFASRSRSLCSIAMGFNCDATGINSIALGSRVTALADNTVSIGGSTAAIGVTPAVSFVNNIQNSLMVGFQSTVPTFFVGQMGQAGNTFGRVGVGTTNPQCTFGVNGTACFGWGGDDAVPAPVGTSLPVSMMVENTVIIGGSGGVPAFINGARSGQASLLHVWGDAVKLGTSGTSSWDIPSDARYKKDVRPFTDGLEQLRQINPVRFRYNQELGIPQGDDDGIGVIAQDIQKVLPYTVHENSLQKSVLVKEEKRYQVDAIDTVYADAHHHGDVESINNDKDVKYVPTKKWVTEPAEYRTDSKPLLTYNSSALTYVIVNAIKEIDAARTADKAANDSLRLVVKNLEERIARLEANNAVPLTEQIDVILEQNNPNPFSDNASITYYIPEKVSGKAEMLISSTDQKTILQQFPLEKGMPSQITVDAKDFKTGVYVYSLAINGRILAAKKLIIIK